MAFLSLSRSFPGVVAIFVVAALPNASVYAQIYPSPKSAAGPSEATTGKNGAGKAESGTPVEGTKGYEAMKRGLLPARTKHEVAATISGADLVGREVPWQIDPSGDRAFNPATGENAIWDEAKQQWMDAKTGKPISESGNEHVAHLSASIRNGDLVVTGGVNCDCEHVEAGLLTGPYKDQCRQQERVLKEHVALRELKIQIADGKIAGPEPLCDSVASGPSAWPLVGAAANPEH